MIRSAIVSIQSWGAEHFFLTSGLCSKLECDLDLLPKLVWTSRCRPTRRGVGMWDILWVQPLTAGEIFQHGRQNLQPPFPTPSRQTAEIRPATKQAIPSSLRGHLNLFIRILRLITHADRLPPQCQPPTRRRRPLPRSPSACERAVRSAPLA